MCVPPMTRASALLKISPPLLSKINPRYFELKPDEARRAVVTIVRHHAKGREETVFDLPPVVRS